MSSTNQTNKLRPKKAHWQRANQD